MYVYCFFLIESIGIGNDPLIKCSLKLVPMFAMEQLKCTK